MESLQEWADSSPTLRQFRRRKCLREIAAQLSRSELHKTLSVWSLTSIGVGSVVGAGIFVITGQAAAKYAGPALSVSFCISSIACVFTGLCYAELASAIPIAGSAYSFTYVAVGEAFAWVVALCLTMEYMVAAAAVAVGWSASVQDLLMERGIYLSPVINRPPVSVDEDGTLGLSGSLVNLPAMFIIALLACVLSVGVKESTRFNNIAVAVKMTVLIVFVGYGIHYWQDEGDKFRANLTPFIPPNEGRFGKYGVSGIFRGAGAVFFAYVGFDAVCSVAQECKAPERDLPRGLLATITICTILYVAVTTALTGMMNYRLLNVSSPVIESLMHVDAPVFFRYVVEVGTIAGLTSVCLVGVMSMPRLLFAVANDGLLPKKFAEVHPKFKTPFFSTLAAGGVCCLIAGTFPLDFLGEIVSFGTLVAFSMVCVSVMRLRSLHPTHPRPFRTPMVPLIPIAGVFSCTVQLFSLPPATWRNYSIWLFCGFLVYVLYGRYNSTTAKAAAVGRAGLRDLTFRQPSDFFGDNDVEMMRSPDFETVQEYMETEEPRVLYDPEEPLPTVASSAASGQAES